MIHPRRGTEPEVEAHADLRTENALLRDFVETSRDALWCIEFLEPVELSAPEHEVVRQVFENACVWRLCNPAMARLYRLPPERDFNAQNVRFAFPRNVENEAFVRTLIAANFRADGVRSLDYGYDGTAIEMENDVRGHVVDGRLRRMMGAVRNVSAARSRERELAVRHDILSAALAAVPDVVLAVDRARIVLAANAALAWHCGWTPDDVLGRSVDTWLSLPVTWPAPGAETLATTCTVHRRAGGTVALAARVNAFAGSAAGAGWIIVLSAAG